ncbi:MAG TPA: sulfite exporter TauE/SafE family protein [Verrucomicrobiales bacterium]|nr:sulfite exporter TauE/SafE family protein [Verrucomicrobiales bacterium]HIL68252.1 sulfite exporter TauE/SafE family protein [Verrucomicrobiota bacterium]
MLVDFDGSLSYIIVGFGVFFIGFSKAGFGGGMGMLTVPICALALADLGKPPVFAVGFLLPLLVIGDALSVYHYRNEWKAELLKPLFGGILIGTLIGTQLIGRFPPQIFNTILGILAVVFVLFQVIGKLITNRSAGRFEGTGWGFIFGTAAGVTSTFAHGAGPVIAIYLIPKNLPKKVFVGTNAFIFCIINWIKVPFFFLVGAINKTTLLWGLSFMALVPIGTVVGIWLSGKIPEKQFLRIIYLTTFLAGVKLIWNGVFG